MAFSDPPLLQIEDLRLYFRTQQGVLHAVDSVSLNLRRNEAMVILGESGCGKTSLTKAILRLLPRNVHTYSGSVKINGQEVMQLSDEEYRQQVRWVQISLVPQAAMNSLNPVLKVGDQVAEPLLSHSGIRRTEALERVAAAFQHVGVPADFINRYAFELSGGMRQRVAIAMAMVTDPDLIILDEPTSALDVLTQANIMNVLKRVKQETSTSFILITHDIGASSELADRGRRHVRRPAGRTQRRRAFLCRAAPSLFPETHGQRSQAAPDRGTGLHQRSAPQPARPAPGLSLCTPLPPSLRALRQRSRPGPGRPPPTCEVLATSERRQPVMQIAAPFAIARIPETLSAQKGRQ